MTEETRLADRKLAVNIILFLIVITAGTAWQLYDWFGPTVLAWYRELVLMNQEINDAAAKFAR